MNYTETTGLISDNKIFLYIDIKGKISPDPLWPSVFTNHDGLNNLARGSPKEHFCQIILKSVNWFLTRRFLKIFSFGCHSKWIPNLRTSFSQYHPRSNPVKICYNWLNGLGDVVKKIVDRLMVRRTATTDGE